MIKLQEKMKKVCKLCGNIITIKEVKDQAKDDPIRTKNIKKDYYISLAFGYCITCLRTKKQDKIGRAHV